MSSRAGYTSQTSSTAFFLQENAVKTRQERVVAVGMHLFASFVEPFDVEQRLAPPQ
jgi:hypothetical protein